MSVRAQCSGCSRKLLIPDNLVGKTIRCPQCSTQFVAKALSDQGLTAQPTAQSVRAGAPAKRPTAAAPAKPRSLLRKLVLAFLVLGFLGFGVLLAGGAAVLWWAKTAALSEWKEYASKEGGFSVLLPGTPAESKKPDAKIEEGVDIREVKAGVPDTNFSVQFYDLGDAPINQYLFFTGLKNKFLAAFPEAKVVDEQEVKLKDYMGREFALELAGNKTLVRRVYLVENRVFFVSAEHPKVPVPPADNQKFFNSFTITKAPEAKIKPKTEDPSPKVPDAPIAKAPEKPAFAMSNDERDLFNLINDLREKEKVAKLRPNQKLFDAARAAAKNNVSPDEKQLGFRRTFILTSSANVGVPEMFNLWIRSKSTKATMTDAFEDIGIGISEGADGSFHYVVVFGGNTEENIN